MKRPKAMNGIRTYDNPTDMENLIEDYFAKCDEEGEYYTYPGLAFHLGFQSRQSLWDYAQKDEFRPVIERAKLVIEIQRNKMLLEASNKGVTGIIFDLKNNFDWKDRSEVENTIKSPEPVQFIFMDQPKDKNG